MFWISSFLVLILFFFIFISLRAHQKKQTSVSPHTSSIPLPPNGHYIIEDSSNTPQVPLAVVHAKVIRETKQFQNHIWQKITLANTITGSQRVLFEQEEDKVQFEKIDTPNWSPSNRFFYIFLDLPDGRRNLLIFETDGRFTNTQ